MDKIIEGNKLIAEFMGGIYYSDTNLFVFFMGLAHAGH